MSNQQLASLAKVANVPLPENAGLDHAAQTAELEKLNGAAFDVAYLRQQLLEHQKTVTLLQGEMSQGQDAALQRHAMESLPVVLEHLQMAQAIFARLTGWAARAGGVLAVAGDQSPRRTVRVFALRGERRGAGARLRSVPPASLAAVPMGDRRVRPAILSVDVARLLGLSVGPLRDSTVGPLGPRPYSKADRSFTPHLTNGRSVRPCRQPIDGAQRLRHLSWRRER
jgi:Domain of unknown function (DUF4142)